MKATELIKDLQDIVDGTGEDGEVFVTYTPRESKVGFAHREGKNKIMLVTEF